MGYFRRQLANGCQSLRQPQRLLNLLPLGDVPHKSHRGQLGLRTKEGATLKKAVMGTPSLRTSLIS